MVRTIGLTGVAGAPHLRCRRAPSTTSVFRRAAADDERDPAAATRGYQRVLAAQPTHADAHTSLGRQLHRCGDLGGAEAHYRLAILSAPEVAALPWFNLGVLLEAQGRSAEAAEAYRAAVGADGDAAAVHDATGNLIALLHERGDQASLQEAIRVVSAQRRNRRG